MNDINRLMDLDPLDLKNEDIETLIAYHRQQRGAFDAGHQPKKKVETATVDLSSMMKAMKAPEEKPMQRRKLT